MTRWALEDGDFGGGGGVGQCSGWDEALTHLLSMEEMREDRPLRNFLFWEKIH